MQWLQVQHQYKLTDESGPAHKKSFTVCLKIGDKAEVNIVYPLNLDPIFT